MVSESRADKAARFASQASRSKRCASVATNHPKMCPVMRCSKVVRQAFSSYLL